MNANQIHEEIKETNLTFMVLAQQLIRGDKESAMKSFGVNEEMANLVAGLSPAQLLKMSASNMLLCCFHFDEQVMLNMLTDYKKDSLFSRATSSGYKQKQMAEAVAA
ncbi:MAG: flagellar transcriptional regulator FlhD [Gallionellaceae bacterium]|jgi:flagellar transcriptional activator FlhD